MLYWLAKNYLSELWGPFRLLESNLVLMSVGTLLAGFLTWWLLPKCWTVLGNHWYTLPRDRGKSIAGDGGKAAAGKPTGAGMIISLILLPIIFLFVPLDLNRTAVILFLYLGMLFGYLDDASKNPWGEWRKGILDLLVTLGASYFLYRANGSEIWIPFYKETLTLSPSLYVLGGAILLWWSTNATNCSDGVDGLAGSLTLLALLSQVALLYLVVGYAPVAKYLLIPCNPDAAHWAILASILSGSVGAYLWYNAEPSKVLMGDAGSRLLGLMIGVLVMVSGNPFLIFVSALVLLVNGGTGLLKLLLLRFFKVLGFDVRPPDKISPSSPDRQYGFIKALHSVRFPLHDHCRKRKGWTNSMVLMRFLLIQAFLTPILFVIFVKFR